MSNQQQAEIPLKASATLCRKLDTFLRLGVLLTVCCSAVGQSKPDSAISGDIYADAGLAFRYTLPKGMRDKTKRFPRLQIQNPQPGTPQALDTLLALSSGPDGNASDWRSMTIVTYPRDAVSERDDAEAAGQMNAWVAHSKDTSALPKSVVISDQSFIVSVFGLQEGTVKKGAVVWTTIRKGQLLSFAFVANSPQQLKALAESMKTVQFF